MSTSTFKPEFEALQRIVSALDDIDPLDNGIAKLTPVLAGRSNETWLLTTEAGEIFVVQRARGNVAKSTLEACCQFANFLAANGLRCVSYMARRGESVFLKADGMYRIMRYIPGAPLNLNPTINELEKLWDIYQAIREAGNKFPGRLPCYRNSAFYVERLRKVFNELSSTQDFKNLQNTIQFDLKYIGEKFSHSKVDTYKMCISHGDLNVRNFIVQDEIPYILDFENCASLPVWHDLGDAVRSWCSIKGHNGWAISQPKLETFIRRLSDFENISVDQASELSLSSAKAVLRKLIMHLICDFFEKRYYNHNTTAGSDALEETRRLVTSQITLLKDINSASFR